MKPSFLGVLTIYLVAMFLMIAGTANAASVSFVASQTVSKSTSGVVYPDNYVRAYDDLTTDIYGFILFDVSALNDAAVIQSLTLTTYHAAVSGSPYGNPAVQILYSSNNSWTRSTAAGVTFSTGPTVSPTYTSFPSGNFSPHSWNLDVMSHDWTIDLADNFITLAMNQTYAASLRYVYWHGSDFSNYAPRLEIQYSVVPIPPTLYLFGTGLLGLVGMARRTRAQPRHANGVAIVADWHLCPRRNV